MDMNGAKFIEFKDNILDIVKQKKMVAIDERGFFDLFYAEENILRENSFGGIITIDGIDRPFISVFIYEYDSMDIWVKNVKDIDMSGDNISPYKRRKYEAGLRGELLFNEYEDFHNDPEIGDCICTNIYEYVQCIMAHETAHALQHWNCEPGWNEPDVHAGHNDVWKRDYRILRRALGLVRK